MSKKFEANELQTFKAIAETLNESQHFDEMLQSVLHKLLEVTGLQTGWMFIVRDKPDFMHAADVRLPPALSWGDKQPMRCGSCTCLDRYWGGKLTKAVNIIACQRLNDAQTHQWGDTHHLTHHATVPLTVRGEKFGLLNVASPGKHHFDEQELHLLQSVAYQIGTSVERTWLYEKQIKRTEQLKILDQVSRSLWNIHDQHTFPAMCVQQMGEAFQWDFVAWLQKERDGLVVRASYLRAGKKEHDEHIQIGRQSPLYEACQQEEVSSIPGAAVYESSNQEKQLSRMQREQSSLFSGEFPIHVIPLHFYGKFESALVVQDGNIQNLDDLERETIKGIQDHLSLIIRNIQLNDERKQMIVAEERNRLARDLHDSVNQKLFSLSLTARGGLAVMDEDQEKLKTSLHKIQSLSQEALQEMRALIWQLRPPEVEQGLITGLQSYATSYQLTLDVEVQGVSPLPRLVEETLWRIGQECLNNIYKHARTKEAKVSLQVQEESVQLIVEDHGAGFEVNATPSSHSMGLSSMKERAEKLKGTVHIHSNRGHGTRVAVLIPLKKNVGRK